MGRTFRPEERERHRKRKPGRQRRNDGPRFEAQPTPMQSLDGDSADGDCPDDWSNAYDGPSWQGDE